MHNNFESEMEWLFYNLWTKTGPTPPKFNFKIPDTIFYQSSHPDVWYFTNKEGFILKKNKLNVNQKVIHQDFTKKKSLEIASNTNIVASAYYFKKDQLSFDIFLEHIPQNDFKNFMFFEEEGKDKPNVLQKFVSFKGTKNSMLKCQYSQALSVVEKQINNNNFFDSKISLDDRVPTFEGPPHVSRQESIASESLIDEVNQAVKQIGNHVFENNGTRILGGAFYFKIDKKDNLVLLFCSNLKTDKQILSFMIDQLQINLRLFAQMNKTVLPSVTITNKKDRPQSQYGSKKNRLNSSQCCPLCDIKQESFDGLDVNLNQILKIHSYHQENTDFPINLISFPADFMMNDKLQGIFHGSRQYDAEIPRAIQVLQPTLSVDKYAIKKNDPLFLYESFKVCTNCYKYVKSMLEFINFQTEDKYMNHVKSSSNLSSQPINRQIQFYNQKISSQTESLVSSEQLSFQSQKPYIKKQSLIPLSQHSGFKRASKNDLTKNIKSNSLQRSDSERESKDNYSARLNMERQKFESARQNISYAQSKNHDISDVSIQSSQQKPQNTMLLMFSKVEQGKEVGSYVKMNDNQELKKIAEVTPVLEQSKSYIEERKKRISIKDKNFQRVQANIPKPRDKDSQQQKILYPRIDWEKEYHIAVKAKTQKAKDEIFRAVDQIENGQFEQLTKSDSLDLNLQQDAINNTYHLFQAASQSYISSLQQQPNPSLPSFYPSSILKQQQPPIIGGIRESRLFTNFYDSNLEQKPFGISKNTNADKLRKQQSDSYTLQSVAQQKEFEQIYKENIQNTTNQIQKIKIQPVKRIRPMSSKPPINKCNQPLNSDIDMQSNQAQKYHLSNSAQKQQDAVLESSQILKRQPKKQQPKQRVKSANRTSGSKKQEQQQKPKGLFDFQNMSHNDIQQIAQNADTLIQIIQNIKNTNATGGDKTESVKQKQINNLADEPCFEESDEEDCTQDEGLIALESQRSKRNENDGGWW